LRVYEKEVISDQDYWLVFERKVYHVRSWWFERAAMYEFWDFSTELFITRDFALNPENWKKDFRDIYLFTTEEEALEQLRLLKGE
jgi:hypothetical protein